MKLITYSFFIILLFNLSQVSFASNNQGDDALLKMISDQTTEVEKLILSTKDNSLRLEALSYLVLFQGSDSHLVMVFLLKKIIEEKNLEILELNNGQLFRLLEKSLEIPSDFLKDSKNHLTRLIQENLSADERSITLYHFSRLILEEKIRKIFELTFGINTECILKLLK